MYASTIQLTFPALGFQFDNYDYQSYCIHIGDLSRTIDFLVNFGTKLKQVLLKIRSDAKVQYLS